jgi:hypothetical protein
MANAHMNWCIIREQYADVLEKENCVTVETLTITER